MQACARSQSAGRVCLDKCSSIQQQHSAAAFSSIIYIYIGGTRVGHRIRLVPVLTRTRLIQSRGCCGHDLDFGQSTRYAIAAAVAIARLHAENGVRTCALVWRYLPTSSARTRGAGSGTEAQQFTAVYVHQTTHINCSQKYVG